MSSNPARHVVDAVAGSTALQAVSRIGIPLLLAAAAYGTTTLISLERRVAVLEQGRGDFAGEIVRRISSLETADARDRETMSQVRVDVAALLAQQAATLRALDRVERALERRERN